MRNDNSSRRFIPPEMPKRRVWRTVLAVPAICATVALIAPLGTARGLTTATTTTDPNSGASNFTIGTFEGQTSQRATFGTQGLGLRPGRMTIYTGRTHSRPAVEIDPAWQATSCKPGGEYLGTGLLDKMILVSAHGHFRSRFHVTQTFTNSVTLDRNYAAITMTVTGQFVSTTRITGTLEATAILHDRRGGPADAHCALHQVAYSAKRR